MSHLRKGLPLLLLTLLLGAAAAAADDSKSNSAANMPAQSGINAILGAKRSSEPEFLPPDEAFQLEASADGADRIKLQWAIHEGYYLYKSRIKVATSSTQAQLGAPALPKGQAKQDEY